MTMVLQTVNVLSGVFGADDSGGIAYESTPWS